MGGKGSCGRSDANEVPPLAKVAPAGEEAPSLSAPTPGFPKMPGVSLLLGFSDMIWKSREFSLVPAISRADC